MEQVWLGLGSNLGNRAENLEHAIAALRRIISDVQVSGFWESKARYVENQPDFLNIVARGVTDLCPRELLAKVQGVEQSLGRVREGVVPKGPRTIDIDILLVGTRILVEADLIIPHPGIRDRKFVLLPMLQLDPYLSDPVSGRPFKDFLAELPSQGIYPYGDQGYHAPYP